MTGAAGEAGFINLVDCRSTPTLGVSVPYILFKRDRLFSTNHDTFILQDLTERGMATPPTVEKHNVRSAI